MTEHSYGKRHVVYQADPQQAETVKTLRHKLHGICKEKLMHRHVLVQTLDGQEYEGVIVFVDDGHVYLSLAEDESLSRSYYSRYGFPFAGATPFYNPGAAILPLVLYNLLAITLLL